MQGTNYQSGNNHLGPCPAHFLNVLTARLAILCIVAEPCGIVLGLCERLLVQHPVDEWGRWTLRAAKIHDLVDNV